MSESSHVWDMLQRAYAGNAWHGPGLRCLLGEVTADQAAARPVRGAHSIWETAVHVGLLEDTARRRLQGEAVPERVTADSWPLLSEASPEAWRSMLAALDAIHLDLGRALSDFPDTRLSEVVPGRDYPYYVLVHGLAQHELFHAGQLTVLMQAQGVEPRG